jgi:putative PEP-CTERM system TPR-repeat lipoprotein
MRCCNKWNSRFAGGVLTLLCGSLLLAGCAHGGNLDVGHKYQDQGKYRAAYIEAKKTLQHNNKDGNAWLLLGRSALMLGDPKNALADLGHAKANGVPQSRWAVPMARALLVTRQYKKLLQTVSTDPSYPTDVQAQVDVLRGDAHRGLGQSGPARQAYQAALKLHPHNPLALVGLAQLAIADGDIDSANRYLQQALTAAPDNPQVLVAQGDFAFGSHDFAHAESAYQKALEHKHPKWLPQQRFYALARLANVRVQRNQLDKALATIQRLEKISPQQPYPHYLHAVVLYKQGHLADAVSQLQRVLKVAPDNEQAQFLLGAVNYAQGHYSQAEMFFSNVMGMDQSNTSARKMLALTLYREGRSHQALDTLRPAMSGSPTKAALLAVLQRAAAQRPELPGKNHSGTIASPAAAGPFARAGQALASGNESQAIRLLKAMPASGASTEVHRNSLLVLSYLRAKRPDQALKLVSGYAKQHPRSSAARVLYGTTLVAAGKRRQARAEYSQALKLDPKDVAALLSLGSLDSLEGHYDQASARYHSVLKQHPHNAAAMTELARLAMRQGDNAGAIKWFKQAIAAAPQSPTAYVGLVLLYSHSGKFKQAVATAKQLDQADPDNPVALNMLGATELSAGHHSEALKALQKAVHLAPKVPGYRTNLARAQILNKDIDGAKTNLDQVIKADPEQVTAVTLRAFLKLQNHDLPGAIALAKALQQHTAVKAAGYALEGDLYMADKSYHKAAKAYQQGLQFRDDRPLVVRTFHALAAAGAKKPQAVLRHWLSKHPDDAATRLLLAQYYMNHARHTQAADEYQRVLKAYPSNLAALNNLAWIYTEQHNPKSLDLAKRAHALAPESAGIADTYGWALIGEDHPKTALPILEHAAKAAPENPSIQYHLAVAQARTGNHSAALTTLAALQKAGAKFPDQQAAEKLYKKLGGTSGSRHDR